MIRLPSCKILFFTIISLQLGACATSPFNKVGLEQVDRHISYKEAVHTPEKVYNRQVLFGGRIISTQNFSDHTEISLLAFPLDAKDNPDSRLAPLGRIILAETGYLESEQYAPGRLLSARGTLDGISIRRLDQSTYTYPVLRIRELYLWPESYEDAGYYVYPATSINIGVGFGF